MQATIHLTQEGREILQLIWLSEMNGWRPDRSKNENSGECAEVQTAELTDREVELLRSNKFIAGAYVKPPDGLPFAQG